MARPRLLALGLLALLCLGLIPRLAGGAAAPTLRHVDDARTMSFAQLDEVFKKGTIAGGIPQGYCYGYAVVNPRYPGWDVMAQAYWHGKHFTVLSDGSEDEDCGASAEAGGLIKGCGGPRGIVTNYLSLLPRDERVYYQEMPGLVYIGHLRDIHPPLAQLQLDDKPSIIVDYRNKGGDEIRLVNAAEGIYLGRGTDWSSEYPHIFAYFVLQLSDVPTASEVNWPGPAHTLMRDDTFEATGVRGGDPNPVYAQVRRMRPGQMRRQPRTPPRAEREG